MWKRWAVIPVISRMPRHRSPKLTPAAQPAAQALQAQPIALEPRIAAGAALTTITHACLQHFAGNRAAVAAGDAAGIHQMRIGLRRLRAAMSFFKKLLDDRESRRIKRELQWLLGELGPVRDLDVLIGDSIAPMQRDRRDGAALTALESELRNRRRTSVTRAQAAVASARYRVLIRDTGLWASAGAWTEAPKIRIKARVFAAAEFARRQRKLTKKLKRLAALDAPHRHKLRIAVKKLRYADAFFADLYDRRGAQRRLKRQDKALKALQSALGKLNDMRAHDAIAGDFIRTRQRTTRKPQKAFAFGLIAGEDHAHSAALLRAATKAGKHLRAAKSFWN